MQVRKIWIISVLHQLWWVILPALSPMVYLSLFGVSFLAATMLPAGSEVMFAGLLAAGYDPLSLWIWASAGNTLGACANWLLGRYLLHFRDRRWFPFKPDSLERSQRWFGKYGLWSLLLSWAPIIGDPLTFVAGVMRVNFWLFLLLCGIAKGTRYLILIALLSGF